MSRGHDEAEQPLAAGAALARRGQPAESRAARAAVARCCSDSCSASHERAFRRLRPALGDARRVLIVGGGLFPRTALVVRRVMPEAEIEIVDAVRDHLDVARPFLDERVSFACATFDAAEPIVADLVILPLAFIGDRARGVRRSAGGPRARPRLDLGAPILRRRGVLVAAQATESRGPLMRALALGVTLIAAKALSLAGQALPASWVGGAGVRLAGRRGGGGVLGRRSPAGPAALDVGASTRRSSALRR